MLSDHSEQRVAQLTREDGPRGHPAVARRLVHRSQGGIHAARCRANAYRPSPMAGYPWTLPRRGKYSAAVRDHPDLRSIVSVEHRLPTIPGLGQFDLYSTVKKVAVLEKSDWRDGVKRRIERRLQENRGAAKGRVLWIALDDAPAAVLSYHVEDDGPLEVLEADAASWLWNHHADWAEHTVETLFDCLLDVSASAKLARGRSTLRWRAQARSVAQRAQALWGFATVGQTRGEWLGERRWN